MNFIKKVLADTSRMIWAVFIAALFALYSGTWSHLYDSSFQNWGKFASKFFQIDFGLYFLNLALAFAGAAGFALICVSLGSVFVQRRSSENFSSSNWLGNLATAFLFGEIIFSFILMGLSLAGKLLPVNTLIILLAGGGLGAGALKRMLANWKSGEKLQNEKWVIGFSLAILISAAFFTTSRISYDSTAFYFSNAKLTAMNQRLSFFANSLFTVGSFHTGILYAALIQMAGDQSARFFSWINGALIAALTLALSAEVGLSRKGKALTLALLFTSTAFVDPLGDGKIEIASSLFALAAVYWLVKSEKKYDLSNSLFAGICAGFAALARPYNLVLLGGFFGIYFLSDSKFTRARIKSYLVMALPILLALMAHLGILWLVYGNPLTFARGAENINAENWQWSGFDPQNIWLARLFYPLTVTFFNIPQSMGSITPLVAIFLPLMFYKKAIENLSQELKRIAVSALLVLAAWVAFSFTVFEIRYVFFLWIVLYIAFAETLQARLETLKPAAKKIYAGILFAMLAYILARNLFVAVDSYAPFDVNGNPQCNDSAFCNYLSPINQKAAIGDRTLSLSAFRYYLRPDLFACSSQAEEYEELKDAAAESDAAFWLAVQRQGYAYIAYEENYSMRHLGIDARPLLDNPPSWVKLEQLRETYNGYFSAYAVEFTNPPQGTQKICIQEDGIWSLRAAP